MRERAGSDSELIDLLVRVAQGDSRAFEPLYRGTVSRLSKIAFDVLGHEQRIEEVLQEAYLKIWLNAPCYCPRIASPMTWMCAVVRNEARDRLRRREFRLEAAQSLHEEPPDARSIDPAGAVERQCSYERALASLDQLGARKRQCLLLLYRYDLSPAEVALRLEVPASTVRTWSQRGLAEMRTTLSGRRDNRSSQCTDESPSSL